MKSLCFNFTSLAWVSFVPGEKRLEILGLLQKGWRVIQVVAPIYPTTPSGLPFFTVGGCINGCPWAELRDILPYGCRDLQAYRKEQSFH